MPDIEKANETDVSETSTRDRREEKDKGSKAKGGSKVKDLSHVPCKFFKVGSCTAGPSCPFSHHSNEPGQQKDVCAWYVKGNCKFGHKCALAHVLPGQSMSMDRRNKKAAQLAAGGGPPNGQKEGTGKADRVKTQKPAGNSPATARAGSGQTRSSSLLTGSTAPTRVLPSGSRPPIPISKAVPAPATPAPALKDADFATFDLPKVGEATSETVGTSTPVLAAEEHDQPPRPDALDTHVSAESAASSNDPESVSKSSFLPLSTPSQPRRFTGRHGSSPSVDFGPVGSPPRASPSHPTRVNGFSPGVSPRDPAPSGPLLVSSSPFSAPGGQSLYMPYAQNNATDTLKMKSGLAASLGATRTFNMDSAPSPSQRSVSGPKAFDLGSEALEDDDMEEFIPSSLSDLLTPVERNRRLSRTSSTNPGVTALSSSINRPTVQDHHHRYSRSVPAPSLLHDIKSIWADPINTDPSLHQTPGLGTSPASNHGIGLGTPSSYKSNNGLFPGFGEEGPSPSLLSPTNASAAFLPGLHQHYLSRPSMSNLRGIPQTNHGQHQSPSPFTDSKAAQMSSSPLTYQQHNSNNHNPADPFSSPHSLHAQYPPGRPIPSSNPSFLAPELPLSPSARALQSHAPGQSLPQGLAAGYSRIHVQPPPPNVPSPAMPGTAAFSPGMIGGNGQGYPVGSPDWSTISPSQTPTQPPDNLSGFRPTNSADHSDVEAGGLSSMFSRLSYSAAAARGSPSSTAPFVAPAVGSPGGAVPMSMSRRPSGRGWTSHPLSSPLSGPVLTNDDDDLFSMDEEK